jgi:GNAT superfamily N-acetyltransferase
MNESRTPIVRKAVVSDEPAILALVDALADYEKLARPTSAARKRLMRDMFGPKPRIDCFLAFADGYPEDLFILEEYRRKGVGRALFNTAIEEAKRRGCGRMEWTVLDWNQLAIDFYRKIGGTHMAEWQLYRLSFTSASPEEAV